MPWKQDADGNWGNGDEQPKPDPPSFVENQQNMNQPHKKSHTTVHNPKTSSISRDPPTQQHQHDIQPPCEGKWIFDGEKMVYAIRQLPPIPKYVIPLPAPPSDCGSCYQSDSSLTASIYTADLNFRSNTFDDIERSAQSQIVDGDIDGNEGDNSIGEMDEEKLIQSKNSFASGQKSKRSEGSTAVETDCSSDDLEGQIYPKSKLQQGTTRSKGSQKKRVTLVEPSKTYSDEKKEKNIRIQEEIRKTKRRERCCRKMVYVFVFLSFLAIVIGGGLSAMVHFDVIDLGDLSLDFLSSNNSTDTEQVSILFHKEYTQSPTTSPTLG